MLCRLPEIGQIQDFSRVVADSLGLQNQWGMYTKCCDLRTAISLKMLLHQKYWKCYEVEIAMR